MVSPWGLLGLVVVNIFISYIECGIEYTLRRFADGTKLNSIVETIEGKNAIQCKLHMLEKWVYMKLMRFNKSKCKLLYMDHGKLRYVYRLRGTH